MVRWGVAAAGLLALIVLAGGLLYEYVIKPNQTLATVGSATISRQDYWKSRAIDLYEQALQYQDFAQFVGPDQQGQYLALAQQSLAQLPTVWGSTDVDPASLEKMVDDQVYLQGMDDLGLEMTEDEIRTFALNRFAPPGAPLIAPSPTATLTAERAAMATSTAAALFATPLASPVAATPMSGTPVAGTPAESGHTGTRDTRRHAAGDCSHGARGHAESRRGARHRRGGICPVCRSRSSPWRTSRRRTTSGWWPRPRWPVRKSAMRWRRLSGRARRRCARRISSFRRGRRPRPLGPG